MKCCVPSCTNGLKIDSKNTQKVTFHKVPKEKYCRVAWFAALGIEESELPEAPVVCSLHFKDSNFYNGKNGSKIVQKGAVPFVQVCMICLDTNCKLYPLSKYNLEQAYEILTGLQLQQTVPYLTPAACSECAQRLTNCSQFRHKSLRAHVLLFELFKQHEVLTVPKIRTISRHDQGLASKITQKFFKPNHCDLNVVDSSSVEIEIDNVETKSIVKVEKQDEIVFAFERKENDSFTELAVHGIKNDLNEDIDIDVDFLNDDNDVDFLNNDTDDDGFLDENLPALNDKELNVSNLAGVGVEFVTKVETDKGINENVPKTVVNNIKRTRKGNPAGTKTVRKRTQAVKRNVTKKVDESKPKRAPRSKKSGAPKLVRNARNKLSIFDTTQLTLEEQIAEINKRKESSNYKNSGFQCDVCYKGFITEITYTRHMKKHTKAFGTLECPVCKQYWGDKYALHKHSKSHATRYTCTLCGYTTMTNESARMHENWHKGTRYKCDHCDAEFIKYTSYMTHLRVKHPSDHICNQCGYSYLNELGLRSHLRRIHRLDKVENPDGPLCEECNVRFASSAAYEQHLKVSPKHFTPETRRVNQAVPPRCYSKGSGRHKRRRGDPADVITCEQCGIELKDFLRYTFHFKREHPDKNRTQFSPNNQKVLCELCGKHFQSPHHLKYHMTKHTGQKDFQCDVCEKRFRIKAFLDKHKETHMAMTVRRLYTCAVCDKSFTCQSSLNRHVWVSVASPLLTPPVSNRSTQCDVCEKRFRIKAFLDKHKETHMAMTVRRLYTCAVCDKSFTCQSSLNRHVWIHRGKSFKCEICEKAFSNASERNCHVSHVHMKVPWPKRNRGPNRGRRPSLTKHENYDE